MTGEYPPLTTLEALPLHESIDYEGGYYACEFPERPWTHQTNYDWRCRACVRHAEARVATMGDVKMYWHADPDADYVPTFLGWLVARSKCHLDMP